MAVKWIIFLLCHNGTSVRFHIMTGCMLASGVIESATGTGLQVSVRGIITGILSRFFCTLYGIFSKIATGKGYSIYTILLYSLLLCTIVLLPLTDWNTSVTFISGVPVLHSIFAVSHSFCTSILPYLFIVLPCCIWRMVRCQSWPVAENQWLQWCLEHCSFQKCPHCLIWQGLSSPSLHCICYANRNILPDLFTLNKMARQQTLCSSFTLSGYGLHSGWMVNISLHPAPENFGYRKGVPT